MRKVLLISLALIMVLAISGFAQDHAYTDVNKCKMCHQRERGGMIYEKWAESAHAKAFETLGSEAALAIAADAQTNPNCLKCHVTGGGAAEGVDNANGVSCEACHGAGGDYWKKSVMEDREAAIAAGMVAAPQDGCIQCHNEESPTFKGFDFPTYFEKIKHDLPAE